MAKRHKLTMAEALFNPIKGALARYNTIAWIAMGLLVLGIIGAIWKVPILSDIWGFFVAAGVGLAALAGFGTWFTALCCFPIALLLLVAWLVLKPSHPPEPIRKWHPRFKRR